MGMMTRVNNWDELLVNIKQLESYRHSNNSNENKFFISLIIKGICFLAYKLNDEIAFYPSRFIGYFNNNIQRHNNSRLYGPETNEAIKYMHGYEPSYDESLDLHLEEFSQNIGLLDNSKGSFGKQRKYWYVGSNKKISSKFDLLKQKESNRKNKRKNKVPFNEDYKAWKFTMLGDSAKLASGEFRVPIINNKLVEVKGKMVSEIYGYFELYKERDRYEVRINRWNDLNKHQKFIVVQNVSLKLREIIYK